MNLLLMLFFPIVDELDVDFARINEDSALVGCHILHHLFFRSIFDVVGIVFLWLLLLLLLVMMILMLILQESMEILHKLAGTHLPIYL